MMKNAESTQANWTSGLRELHVSSGRILNKYAPRSNRFLLLLQQYWMASEWSEAGSSNSQTRNKNQFNQLASVCVVSYMKQNLLSN